MHIKFQLISLFYSFIWWCETTEGFIDSHFDVKVSNVFYVFHLSYSKKSAVHHLVYTLEAGLNTQLYLNFVLMITNTDRYATGPVEIIFTKCIGPYFSIRNNIWQKLPCH